MREAMAHHIGMRGKTVASRILGAAYQFKYPQEKPTRLIFRRDLNFCGVSGLASFEVCSGRLPAYL